MFPLVDVGRDDRFPWMSAELITAVAAVAAAFLVGWQSWETRKSAEGSRRAVESANRALALATAEEAHSRELIREAVRSRMDAVMPDLLLTVSNVEWPPIVAGPHGGTIGMNGPAQADPFFRLPRDAGCAITLRGTVRIYNDSRRTVQLYVGAAQETPAPGHWRLSPSFPTIAPEGHEDVPFQVTAGVQSWTTGEPGSENWPGQTGPPFTASYWDPADSGATDSWYVQVIGSPLQAVPDQSDTFEIPDEPPQQLLSVSLRRRRYMLNRERDQEL
jgi:hypothetical protein